ncbi:hypothetical protein V6N13_040573 [Hibiscus sabdariffa]|uniref:Pectinesterase n=1 Tax=Hibiscus sabdariffa TaxID=183260 RepID=A0ABR2R8S7_9ROSI
MVNNVVFIIVMLVAVVASALTVYFAIGLQQAKKSKDERESQMSSSNKAIQAICQPTKFKDACEQSMSSANSSEPKELIRAEFKATVEEIKRVMEHSATLQELKKDEKTKAAFADCELLFDWAIQDLERSFDKLGEIDMGKIDDVLLTLQVWLSGALTSQQTCLDSYSEMDGQATAKMTSLLTKSQELTRNGLTILNGLQSLTKDLDLTGLDTSGINRRLMSSDSEFPEWMSLSDRRLLQEAPDEAASPSPPSPTDASSAEAPKSSAESPKSSAESPKSSAESPKSAAESPKSASESSDSAAATGDFKPNVIVAKDGSGKYESVAKAVADAPKRSKERYIILIKAGIYNERVDIPKGVDNIMFIGEGPTKTIITESVSVEKTTPRPTTFNTATVSAAGVGFIAKDITFENSIGPEGHQAVAVRASGDMSAFYNCHFNGYQDTLYAHEGRQFYRDCTITGTIDFVFGDARAVFQNTLLVVRKPMQNQACIVIAEGRKNAESSGGYVFQNCTFSGDKEYLPVKNKNKSYLNRPWRAYAKVIIMQSQIDDIIQPEGYIPMDGDKGLTTGYFVEYGNRGPGANTENRVKWPSIQQLDESDIKKYTPGPYLESESWIPELGIPCIPNMIPGL